MGTRVTAGILLVAGIVLLVIRPAGWIIAGLSITIAAAIRIYDLRRGRLRSAPWPVVIIALLMSHPAACRYLEEVGGSAGEVEGDARRRQLRDAFRNAPGTLVTVWRGRLRSPWVKLAGRVLSHRVEEMRLLIEDATPDQRRYQVALRRLRRYCWLILCATGSGDGVYSRPARALRHSCRESAVNAGDADLAAQVRQDVKKLACALTSERPDRA